MVIKNLLNSEIASNKNQSSKFLSIKSEKNLFCQIYSGDFYLDSQNFFLITAENFSFSQLFGWSREFQNKHFFTSKFQSSFNINKKNCRLIKDANVLGSSFANNYYRNLISFIPRIFFIHDKEINLVIHRNSSNKLRNFLKYILETRGIKLKKFIFLDNDLYFFKNSKIPQFFPYQKSVRILNKLLNQNLKKNKLRLYLTRKNALYRKLINETDIIDTLKLKNFIILDTDTLSINKQIELFSSAEIIIGPTGSALANIVFCNKGTKVFEIMPKYKYSYENNFKLRYANICRLLGLKHFAVQADPIKINEIDEDNRRFIDPTVISNSNYYKDLLVNERDVKKFINLV